MPLLRQKLSRIFGVFLTTLALLWGGGFYLLAQAQTPTAVSNGISVSLYLLGADSNEVANGEYAVRFALYSKDRTESDPYPSNGDAGARMWEETQKVSVYNGVMTAFLGTVTPFPQGLTFNDGEYYLGIQINQDAEIAPRKKLGTVPMAINSQFLRGKTVGTNEGDLVALGNGGKLDTAIIPEITAVGTVSQGVWEGEVIESDFIADALTNKTYNGLILTQTGSGFTVKGGSSTLSVSGNSALNQDLLTTSAPQFVGLGLRSATAPTAPRSGDMYADGTNLYFYNGSVWEDLTLASAGGTVSGSGTAGQLTYWSDALTLASATLASGNGISMVSGSGTFTVGIDLTENPESAVTTNESSRSGLETTSNGLQLLGGCSDGQVLAWDSSNHAWACSNKTGGTSDWTTANGTITYLSDTSDDFAIGAVGGSPSASTSIFGVDRTNGQFYFASDNALSQSPTLNFTAQNGATGTLAYTTSDSFSFTGGNVGIGVLGGSAFLNIAGGNGTTPPMIINSGTTLSTPVNGALENVGGELFFTRSGTQEQVAFMSDIVSGNHQPVSMASGTTLDYLTLDYMGQIITLNAIDFSTDVTGTLPTANGGTGIATLPASGQVLLGNGTGYGLVTLAGNDGVNLTNNAGTLTFSASLGTSIDTLEIDNGTILAGDLNSDTPAVGEVLMYNSVTGGFTWEDITAAGGAGDIFAVGDVSSGEAFTNSVGATGSNLYFHNSGFTGNLTVGTLSGSSKTYTLPNATGTIITTGNLSSITSVGTITSGTWNGTSIADANVDNTLTISGGTISGSAITLDGTSNNTSGRISWDGTHIVVGTGSSAVTFYSGAGAGGLTAGSGNVTNNVAYWSGANQISGEAQLSATRGGTGIGTYTVGDLLYANTTTTLDKRADVATGNVLLSGGVGVAPSWGKVDLTTHVTGTLPTANGGTNVDGSSAVNGTLLIGNGTGYTLASPTAGAGISITNPTAGSITIASSFGSSIDTLDILNATILPEDIDVNGAIPSEGNVLVYSGGKFNWISPSGSGGIGDISDVGDASGGPAFTQAGTGSLLYFHNSGFTGLLQSGTLTASHTYTLPNKDGTLATTDDVGSASHAELTLLGAPDYLSLVGQALTMNAIDLANSSNVTGLLRVANGGTGIDGSTAVTGQLLIGNGSGFSLGSIVSATTGAMTITNASGNIRLAIDLATTATATSTQSSVSGMETTSDGLRMLGGCADGQVLAWDIATSKWQCSSKTGGTSDWTTTGGTITYLTDTGDDFAIGGSTVNNSVLSVSRATGTIYIGTRVQTGVNPSIVMSDENTLTGTLAFQNHIFSIPDAGVLLGAGNANRAPLKLTSGTNLTTTQQGAFEFDGSQLYFTPGADGSAHRRIAYFDEVGVGLHNAVTLDTSAFTPSAGYLSIDGSQVITVNKISLSSNDVMNTLPVTNGGTGATTFTQNGILMGNGTGAVTVKVPGVAGQMLLANGSSVPTFTAMGGDATINGSGTLAIAGDAVALGTETTGSYVASVASGSGIAGGAVGSEGATLTLALGALTSEWDQTGAFNIFLDNASSNLKMLGNAGSTAGTYGMFDVDVLTANRTYTFPNDGGYVALGSGSANQVAYWNSANKLAGENALATSRGGTGLTSTPTNGQLLIGNGTGYTLATISNGTGTTVNSGSGTISIDATLGIAIDSTEITDDAIAEVDLKTGAGAPGNGYVLTYNLSTGGFTWVSPTTVGNTGPDMTAVGDVLSGDAFTSTTTDAHSLWFYDGTNGSYRGLLTSNSAGLTGNQTYTLPNATGTILVQGASGNLSTIDTVGTITSGTWNGTAIDAGHGGTGQAGGYAVGNLLYASGASALSTLAIGSAGNVLTVSGGVPAWGSLDLASSASVGTSKLGAVNGGTGLDTSASTGVPTIASGVWSVASSLSANKGGTGQTTFAIGDMLYADTSSTLSKLSAGTSGYVLKSSGAGTAPSWGQVSLTAGVSGQLPLANGGTNANLTASNGGIVYSGASSLAILSGTATAGQALISGASGAPTWFAPTAGSILFAGTGGILQQDNANIFWDDSTNRLGLGTTSPQAMLSLYGANNKMRLGYDASNYVDFSTSATSTLTIQNASSTEPIIRLSNGTTQDASIQFDGASTDFYAGMDDTLSAYMIGTGTSVGSNTALTVDTTGKIGIGTTAPGTKLAVSGLTATSSYNLVRVNTATGDFYYDASSARYKDNIKNFDEDFSQILDVDPKIYTDKTSGLTEIGFIAEELDTLGLTHLVNYSDGIVDGVKYERVPLYLLGLAKEQQKQIETNASDIVDQGKILASLQATVDAMKEENKALIDFFTTLNPDTMVVKDALGNVNLAEGKLEAGGVVAGVFTVRVAVDKDGNTTARTIGTDTIKANNPADSPTESTVYIETTAITKNSKIFVTPKDSLDTPISVGRICTDTDSDICKDKGFVVRTKGKIDKDITFDWVMVEEERK